MSSCSNKALGQKHGKLEMALIDYDVSYLLARGLYLSVMWLSQDPTRHSFL